MYFGIEYIKGICLRISGENNKIKLKSTINITKSQKAYNGSPSRV